MKYASINRNYKENQPKFWLCLPYPRRTGIRKLTEIYNVNIKLTKKGIHELTFDIPSKVERNHRLIFNPLIELFEAYYLVKMEWNNEVTYFVYVNGSKKSDKSGRTLSYKLYSTAYLIGKHAVPIYEEESLNIQQHAEEFLVETNWTISHIDDDLLTTYRSLSLSQSNALQALYDLVEKFEAVAIYDTVNQEISFYKPESLKSDKGMTFNDGVTLESLGQEINYDEIVTRLYVYGSDGLEFRELSLVGVNYIQDFSWFIYPFEQDSNGNVIKSSKWLTDDFCKNYIIYNKALVDVQPIFDTLTFNLTSVEDNITQLESSLSNLKFELNQIENELWVINKTYKDEAPLRQDWQDATNRRSIKQSQINAMKNQIAVRENDANNYRIQISNLRQSLELHHFFTASQLLEMNNCIHHGYYTNDAIIDVEDLMEDGKKAFKKVNRPPITINMNIVNFFNDVKFEKVRDRIVLGDTVRVKSNELGIYVSLEIIEINYNLENNNITLTISNEQDLRDDMTRLADELHSASHASNIVETNKGNWNKGGLALDEVSKVITNPWDASKTYIIGGYNNTTILDKNGLVSYEQPNSNTYLFINNGILGITDDNLNSLKVAIDKDGVRANLLQGNLILGNNLKLTSDSGVLEADGETVTIRDTNGNKKIELGKYIDRNNATQYGLKVRGGAIDISTSDNPNEGTVINHEGIKVYDSNGDLVFDTSNGADFNGTLGGNVIIDTSQSITTSGSLILKHDTTNTQGTINYYNDSMYFYAGDKFFFDRDIHIIGAGRKMYIDGKEVLTAP